METILRKERLIVGGCLAVMVLLAWWYLFYSRASMPGMDMSGMDMRGMDMSGMIMPESQQWGATAVLLLFVMWAVMMVAMMVPSAAPMVLIFLGVNRRRQSDGKGGPDAWAAGDGDVAAHHAA